MDNEEENFDFTPEVKIDAPALDLPKMPYINHDAFQVTPERKNTTVDSSNEQEEYYEDLSPITNFFITFAGSDSNILILCPKAEIIRHRIMGASVLMNTVLAFFSGGNFLYSSYNSIFAGIIGAFLFSSIVCVLEMSIVANRRKDFLVVTVRLFLSFAIGFIVSQPLEAVVFKQTIIEAQVDRQVERQNTAIGQSMGAGNLSKEKEEMSALYSQLKDVSARAELRLNTKIGNCRGVGAGSQACQDYTRQYNDVLGEKARLEKQIESRASSVASLDNQRTKAISMTSNSLSNDVASQIRALEKIVSTDWSLWFQVRSISLLFILFDMLPVLIKVLSPSGTYDSILQTEESYISDREKLVRDFNTKNNKLLYEMKIRKKTLARMMSYSNEFLDTTSKISVASLDVQRSFDDKVNSHISERNKLPTQLDQKSLSATVTSFDYFYKNMKELWGYVFSYISAPNKEIS